MGNPEVTGIEDIIRIKKIYIISFTNACTIISCSRNTFFLFFKISYSSNIVGQATNKGKVNQPQKDVVDVPNKINYSNNKVVKTINDNKKKVPLETETFVAEISKTINIDTTPILKEEEKAFANNTVVQKPIKKRLKIVYASDFADENDIEKYQQQEKNSTARGIFKMFETSTNKQTEEATTTENNQPQPNKTLLFFKAKPAATISINENY